MYPTRMYTELPADVGVSDQRARRALELFEHPADARHIHPMRTLRPTHSRDHRSHKGTELASGPNCTFLVADAQDDRPATVSRNTLQRKSALQLSGETAAGQTRVDRVNDHLRGAIRMRDFEFIRSDPSRR